MRYTCARCGGDFQRRGKKLPKYCSRTCCNEARVGTPIARRAPLGAVRFAKDNGKGTLRAYIKVGNPRMWKLRALMVWEEANGPLPCGLVIHHRDENSLNDSLDNLAALTRAEHITEHRAKLAAAAKASIKRMGWGPGGKRRHYGDAYDTVTRDVKQLGLV